MGGQAAMTGPARVRAKERIVNRLGLHARAAAKLVRLAGRFESEITLRRDGQEADAKSIMAVMMLGATTGTELELEASGEDAQQALESLRTLISERFGEDE